VQPLARNFAAILRPQPAAENATLLSATGKKPDLALWHELQKARTLAERERLIFSHRSPPEAWTDWPEERRQNYLQSFGDKLEKTFGWSIEGKSAHNTPVQPLARAPGLYKTFAAIQRPSQALAFVARNGLLTKRTGRESVYLILRWAENMHDFLTFRSERTAANLSLIPPYEELQLGGMEAALVPRKDGRMTVVFRPGSLLTGLWLQMANALSDATAPVSCLYCEKLFEVGPGRGRRGDAKFCSDEHRFMFHAKRRKGRS
jgi:hypothetical protein